MTPQLSAPQASAEVNCETSCEHRRRGSDANYEKLELKTLDARAARGATFALAPCAVS